MFEKNEKEFTIRAPESTTLLPDQQMDGAPQIFTENIIQGDSVKDLLQSELDKKISEKQAWTTKQKTIFLQLYQSIGNHWSLISKQIKTRKQNQIKNYFYSSMRKITRLLLKNFRGAAGKFQRTFNKSHLTKIIKSQDNQKDLYKGQTSKRIIRKCLEYLLQVDKDADYQGNQAINQIIYLIQHFNSLNKKGRKIKPVQEQIDIGQAQDLMTISHWDKMDSISQLVLNQTQNSFYDQYFCL